MKIKAELEGEDYFLLKLYYFLFQTFLENPQQFQIKISDSKISILLFPKFSQIMVRNYKIFPLQIFLPSTFSVSN